MRHLARIAPALAVVFSLTLAGAAAGAATGVQAPAQTTFDSPEAAVQALVEAVSMNDSGAMVRVLGPASSDLLSGDPVGDVSGVVFFTNRLKEGVEIVRSGDGSSAALFVGAERLPFPINLERRNRTWAFDTAAGLKDVVDRRMGENEHLASRICRGFVKAQQEYLREDRDGDGVPEYAGRILSTPGKRDGVYWANEAFESESPFGPVIGLARALGYLRSAEGPPETVLVRGYVYRVLTAQGAAALGGRRSYATNGSLTGGFALIAYPITWGASGVKTFAVNHDGKVYQKDFGRQTGDIAAAITEYDVDASWSIVEDE